MATSGFDWSGVTLLFVSVAFSKVFGCPNDHDLRWPMAVMVGDAGLRLEGCGYVNVPLLSTLSASLSILSYGGGRCAHITSYLCHLYFFPSALHILHPSHF